MTVTLSFAVKYTVMVGMGGTLASILLLKRRCTEEKVNLEEVLSF